MVDSPTNRSNLCEDDNLTEKHDKELNTQLINDFSNISCDKTNDFNKLHHEFTKKYKPLLKDMNRENQILQTENLELKSKMEDLSKKCKFKLPDFNTADKL